MAIVNATPRHVHAAGRRADVYGPAIGYEAADPWNRVGETASQPARQHYHDANRARRATVPTWLKVALITACIGLAGIAGPADAQTIGLHLGSKHSAAGYNNVNPGLYLRSADGWTAGAYRNSVRRTSVYAGWTGGIDITSGVRAEVTAGFITGYPVAAVLPMAVPSLRVSLTDEVAARVIFIPSISPKFGAHVVSFAIEWSQQ